MAVQPSVRPDESFVLFSDNNGDRPTVDGTIPRGHLRSDRLLYEGTRGRARQDAAWLAAALGVAPLSPLGAIVLAGAREEEAAEVFPFPITHAVLEQGRNRYMIYCVVCHDPLGTGEGKIVERGYTRPPSYHIERLRQAPPGHFYQVITQGYGSMPDYRQQVPPRDRWAIAAYIRALQLSQHFPVRDLPPDMRTEWEKHNRAAMAAGRAR